MRGLLVWRQSFTRTPLRGSILHADGLQIEPLDVRCPAGSGQNLIHGDALFLALRFIPDDLAAVTLDARDPGVEPQRHPFTDEGLLHKRGGLHVLPIEQVRVLVEEADLGTQPLEGLRQFATDGSATDNRQPRRTLRKAEDGFVGQVARLGQSRDGRLRGARAGRDDRPFEPQLRPPDLHRVRTGEMGLAQKHIHAQLRKALRLNRAG